MSLIFQLLDIRVCNLTRRKFNKSLIQLFGKTEQGESVYIEIDDYFSKFYTSATEDEIEKVIDEEIKILKKYKQKNNENSKRIQTKIDNLEYYKTIINITENEKFKEFYYFNLDKVSVSIIESNSNIALKTIANLLLDNDFKVYESNKDIVLQFIHDRNIKSCGWIEIKKKDLNDINDYQYSVTYKNKDDKEYEKDYTITGNIGYCKINKSCSFKCINPADKEYDLKIAPFIFCSYDIECISADEGFPQYNRKSDGIVSISCTFNKINELCYKKVCLMIYDNKTNKLDLKKYGEYNEIIECNDELDLIKKYFNLINKEDPDIITGWNNFIFDDRYIYERLIRLTKIIEFNDKIILTEKDKENVTKLDYEQKNKLKETIDINISRFNEQTEFVSKKMVSAQMGDNIMNYYDMKGRICFDMMKLIRRERNYISYKLDYVSSQMFRYVIKKYEINNNQTILTINDYEMHELHNDQYIMIIRNDGTADYECFDDKKFRIYKNGKDKLIIDEVLDLQEFQDKGKYYICNVKDDVKPREIFEKYKSDNDYDKEQLALYNIQDCELCNNMANKLFTIINYVGMANVCYVPLNWIFNRGQSQKVYSLVSKKCKEEGYIIRTVKKVYNENKDEDKDKVTYEGAIVVKPDPGIYPAIFCLDYSSLYPSSIIAMNISHETYINDLDTLHNIKNNYGDEYELIKVSYLPIDKDMVELKKKKQNKKYKGIKCIIKEFDEKTVRFQETNQNKECYFVRRKDGVKGLLPQILEGLLGNRRAVRKESEKYKESDPFKYKVLDGLQLAYKVTCNSVYGQLGCDEQIGPIALMDIAACTTATGRKMMLTAQHFARDLLPIIIEYALTDKKKMYDYLDDKLPYLIKKMPNKDDRIKIYENYRKQIRDIYLYRTKESKLRRLYNYKISIVYGDTDSIFVGLDLKYKNNINYGKDMDEDDKNKTKYYIQFNNDKTKTNVIYLDNKEHKKNELVDGLELRSVYMKTGMLASSIINGLLPPPENLEYEKVLSPLVIMSKKRYVGNLYEFDPKKYFQKNMGFVLKRRDNARIVKFIIGGLVDRLLNTPDLKLGEKLAYDFVKEQLNKMIEGKFDNKLFILSKSLKRDYKDRERIVHAVLADRIAKRDPGNAPAPNDRIDFIYRVLDYEPKLQGERVETPEYIKENNLKIDYNFYLTNQILKPCQQIMELFEPDIEQFFKHLCEVSALQKKGIRQITSKDINFNDLFE